MELSSINFSGQSNLASAPVCRLLGRPSWSWAATAQQGAAATSKPSPASREPGLATWDSPKNPSSWAVACKNWNSCSM
ncbi:hypothetical protein HPG69_011279 [Diceros bicornis minor]|uniref:Uncharacterized protein n=1 Tax=Diceros bicornis minor TaxID=77932 RepID=A0A7J7FDL8_DICBM|nr:hypothetical protein HPG69_011279 [Diceros bicornis minor]